VVRTEEEDNGAKIYAAWQSQTTDLCAFVGQTAVCRTNGRSSAPTAQYLQQRVIEMTPSLTHRNHAAQSTSDFVRVSRHVHFSCGRERRSCKNHDEELRESHHWETPAHVGSHRAALAGGGAELRREGGSELDERCTKYLSRGENAQRKLQSSP
jgi:hypothetical protein